MTTTQKWIAISTLAVTLIIISFITFTVFSHKEVEIPPTPVESELTPTLSEENTDTSTSITEKPLTDSAKREIYKAQQAEKQRTEAEDKSNEEE